MSRTGKKSIAIPQGVVVRIEENDARRTVFVRGPKGEQSMDVMEGVLIDIHEAEKKITLSVETSSEKVAKGQEKNRLSAWGMQRVLLSNLILGCSSGFQKVLELKGVGYRAAVKGSDLVLSLGFSHDIFFPIPQDIQVVVGKQNDIQVFGVDKQRVGQVCADIRRFRPPEPYKGKGVLYANEVVFRKEGKKK